mgnify:CR=1 FL=1
MNPADFAYIIDTFFILFAGILIILMAPGFAMLEAGLVRTKNVTTVLTGNILLYMVASTVFVVWGYNFMFGGTGLFLDGIEDDGYSKYALLFFQMAFVSKTVSIISGGVSERIKLLPFMLFAVLMAGLIYPMVGAWTWGGGFLKDMHDLAGSTIIHSVGGWAVLAAILVLGPRKGKYTKDGRVRPIPASNVPLVLLGALLLWIGWFGFNGGSQLSIASKENAEMVALIMLNTNTAGMAGGLATTLIVYLQYRKLDLTMILNGALGGLVAITAGADVVGMWEPIVIGAVGGVLVAYAVPFFDKLRIDDPVGALSVHLVNGIWGTIAVALFNSEYSMMDQLKGIVVVALFTFSLSFALFYAIKKLLGLRSDEEHEYEGLDFEECGVESYPEFVKSKT